MNVMLLLNTYPVSSFAVCERDLTAMVACGHLIPTPTSLKGITSKVKQSVSNLSINGSLCVQKTINHDTVISSHNGRIESCISTWREDILASSVGLSFSSD